MLTLTGGSHSAGSHLVTAEQPVQRAGECRIRLGGREGRRGWESLGPGETVKVKWGKKLWAVKEGEAEAQVLKRVERNEARCQNDFWTAIEKTGRRMRNQHQGHESEHRPVSLGYLLFQNVVRHSPVQDTDHSLPFAWWDSWSCYWKAAHDIGTAKITSPLTVHYISTTLHPGLCVQIFPLPVSCSSPTSHRLLSQHPMETSPHGSKMHFRRKVWDPGCHWEN